LSFCRQPSNETVYTWNSLAKRKKGKERKERNTRNTIQEVLAHAHSKRRSFRGFVLCKIQSPHSKFTDEIYNYSWISSCRKVRKVQLSNRLVFCVLVFLHQGYNPGYSGQTNLTGFDERKFSSNPPSAVSPWHNIQVVCTISTPALFQAV